MSVLLFCFATNTQLTTNSICSAWHSWKGPHVITHSGLPFLLEIDTATANDYLKVAPVGCLLLAQGQMWSPALLNHMMLLSPNLHMKGALVLGFSSDTMDVHVVPKTLWLFVNNEISCLLLHEAFLLLCKNKEKTGSSLDLAVEFPTGYLCAHMHWFNKSMILRTPVKYISDTQLIKKTFKLCVDQRPSLVEWNDSRKFSQVLNLLS